MALKHQRLKDPLRFFYYTGLWFKGLSESRVGKILRFTRSLALTVLCFLTFFATTYHTIKYCKLNTANASYPIACCWKLQDMLYIFIIHRWQSTNILFKKLLPILRLPHSQSIQRRTQKLCLLVVILIVAFLSMVMYVAANSTDQKSEIFSYKKIFNNNIILYTLGRLFGWYMVCAFLIINYYFHCSTEIIVYELKDFNRRFKSEFKAPNDYNSFDSKLSCELACKMHSFYNEHLQLSNQIRDLDKIFNVYTLCNAITAIPCTVFTLWTLFLRINSASWVPVCLSFVELFFCIISLLCLLTNPSRIHALIRETRSLIFSSNALWQIYVPKVCDIGKLFVAHLDQHELGISIWNLITISKSLTLSIVSVTVTFLIFLLELNGSGNTQEFGGVMKRLLD